MNDSIFPMDGDDEIEDIAEKLRAELAAKDRQIEELNKNLDHLGAVLRLIDGDVQRAVKTYLRAEVPHGHLTFNNFLHLLEREIRRTYAKRYANRQARLDAEQKPIIAAELSRRIDQRVEEYMESIIPKLKGRLQDYITFPILIDHYDKPKEPIGQAKFATDNRGFEKVYRANALRASITAGEGKTPEEAYAAIRERLILRLFSKGPMEIASAAHMNNKGLFPAFDEAQSWRSEVIEGFRVDVRLKVSP